MGDSGRRWKKQKVWRCPLTGLIGGEFEDSGSQGRWPRPANRKEWCCDCIGSMNPRERARQDRKVLVNVTRMRKGKKVLCRLWSRD